MEAPEGATLTGQETQELLDAFGAMAPLLKKSNMEASDGGRDHKKAKTQHKPKETDKLCTSISNRWCNRWPDFCCAWTWIRT